eukprot:1352658-Pleurochrysis_carterae.AAC.1
MPESGNCQLLRSKSELGAKISTQSCTAGARFCFRWTSPPRSVTDDFCPANHNSTCARTQRGVQHIVHRSSPDLSVESLTLLKLAIHRAR